MPARAFEPPLFTIQPKPPVAGQDLQVVYHGDSPETVAYQVGNGEVQAGGGGRRFTIPKRLLRGGLHLLIWDESTGLQGAVDVVIEPK